MGSRDVTFGHPIVPLTGCAIPHPQTCGTDAGVRGLFEAPADSAPSPAPPRAEILVEPATASHSRLRLAN